MDSTRLHFLVYATCGYAYATTCAQKTSPFHPTPYTGHSFHPLSILPYCRGRDPFVTLFTLLSMAELAKWINISKCSHFILMNVNVLKISQNII